MRIKRIFGALLTLVTDDHINYTEEGSKMVKFAYFEDKTFLPLFELAIKQNRPIDILIERKQKGKEYDYVTQVLQVRK